MAMSSSAEATAYYLPFINSTKMWGSIAMANPNINLEADPFNCRGVTKLGIFFTADIMP
jgi:hypothetical protein